MISYELTKDWLRTKRIPELTFMVGGLSFESDRRYFTARSGEELVAFAVYNPIYTKKSYYLDLNRRIRDAPNGTMELLFAESFERLKDGTDRIYLGFYLFFKLLTAFRAFNKTTC